MKPKTIALAALLAAMLIFAIILRAGGTLTAKVTRGVARATDYPERFEEAREAVSSGRAPFQFAQEMPENAEGCKLLSLSIELDNNGLLAAEFPSVTVEGQSGDIAVYAMTQDNADIPAHDSKVIDIKLLTTGDVTKARRIGVDYYIFGVARHIGFDA